MVTISAAVQSMSERLMRDIAAHSAVSDSNRTPLARPARPVRADGRRRAAPDPARQRPWVFTKCGLVWDGERPKAPPLQVANTRSIRREVEDSLRRLGVEHIDLYQVHWPSEDGTPSDDDLKRKGKVRAVGLSNHDAAQLARAQSIGDVDRLQPPFSAICASGHVGEQALGDGLDGRRGLDARTAREHILLLLGVSSRAVERVPDQPRNSPLWGPAAHAGRSALPRYPLESAPL
jgi:hypothetical protein